MALNSVYTKHVARAQTVFMICKIIPLIIIIIVGLLDFFVHDQKQNLMTPFADSNWSVKSIFAALLIGSFNYGGWYGRLAYELYISLTGTAWPSGCKYCSPFILSGRSVFILVLYLCGFLTFISGLISSGKTGSYLSVVVVYNFFYRKLTNCTLSFFCPYNYLSHYKTPNE